MPAPPLGPPALGLLFGENHSPLGRALPGQPFGQVVGRGTRGEAVNGRSDGHGRTARRGYAFILSRLFWSLAFLSRHRRRLCLASSITGPGARTRKSFF